LESIQLRFADFIKRIKEGKLLVVGGDRRGSGLLEGYAPLDPKDLDAVTAEGFNQGIFDHYDFARARNQIAEALG
jgi:hypothetical protein